MMMKRSILVVLFIAYAVSLCAQARVKGSGIVYTNGAPTHAVNVNTDAEIAIDTSTGRVWFFIRGGTGWQDAGMFVRRISGTSPPAYTPTDKQSLLVINEADSLYHYRAGSWRHVNRWINDGNKGDITVSSSGATWTINNNAVTDAKLRQSAGLSVVGRASNTTGNVADITAGADGHVLRRSGTTLGFGQVATAGIADGAVTDAKVGSGVSAAKIGSGAVDNTEFGYLDGVTSNIQTQLSGKAAASHTHALADLTQSGASTGQVPKWNGSAWAPANDNVGSGGSSTFIGLDDTPASYSGQAGKFVAVNAGSSALEFVDAPGGVSDGDKGDITVSGSGSTWTIDNNVVSDAKFRQSAGLSVVGRASNTTGNVADITAATDGHVLRRSGASLGFGQVATAGIADGAVTSSKINQSGASPGEILKWNGSAWAVSPDETGATAFTQLTDAPSSYAGHANKLVAVNSSANGLTFVTASSGGGPTFVYKSADEVVNNSTTFQDDDHLTFTCQANKKCFVEYHIFCTNANTSEIKFQVAAAGATTVRAAGTGAVFDFSYTINQASAPIRTYETGGATSEHGFMRISAFIDAGSSDRTVILQWAQQNAAVKNTTVQAGSWLNYIALD
jgi:hypothetical protein